MIIQIIMMIKIKIHLIKNKNKFYYSFSLPLILSYLDINIPEGSSSITNLSYAVFLLSLIGLFCFINVIFFLLVYIIIQKGNYENKYPKLKFLINIYKKNTLIYVAIEAFLCLICFLILIFYSFVFIYSAS